MGDTLIPEVPRMAYRIAELEAAVARLTEEDRIKTAADAACAVAAEAEIDRLTAAVARLTALVEKVVRLRALQRAYFKDRERHVLIEAKQLERELDAALDAP